MYTKMMMCSFNTWNLIYLVSDADIHIFTESIAFGQWCGTVFHEVEGFERTKWRQELFNLHNSRGRTGMLTQQQLQLKPYMSIKPRTGLY